MIRNKIDFMKELLPDTVDDLQYTQISLDTTDLGLSDILRNINKLYPLNSRDRFNIESGKKVVGVLCRSELLDPYNGLFLLVTKKDMEINIISCNYIVLCISEDRITSEEKLVNLMEDITTYLIKHYSSSMSDLNDFYKKFVYNESELYEDEEYNPREY